MNTLDSLITIAIENDATVKGTRLYSGGAYVELGALAREIDRDERGDVRTCRSGKPKARDIDPVIKAWRAAGFDIRC